MQFIGVEFIYITVKPINVNTLLLLCRVASVPTLTFIGWDETLHED
jgi:hypothetical protein